MRKVYENHVGWVRLKQGAVFTGAIADGIEGNPELCGLIITPRCDIANRKVSTIHYLPMIPFNVWKYEILSQIYQYSEYEKLTKSLNLFCEKNGVATSLFDKRYGFSEGDIEESIKHVSGYKDILNKYLERCHLEDITYCKSKVKDWARGRDKIKELIENKQAHYYLIEDWRQKGMYMVIMLRDVKRLEFSFAERMEKGVNEKILSEESFHHNDVFRTENSTMVYKLHSVVASPFLEHIMEAFSKNFCRIGIDRIDDSVLDELKDC